MLSGAYFDQSNPYEQILPWGEHAGRNRGVMLSKEKVVQEDVDFDQDSWDDRRRKMFAWVRP